MATRTTAQPTPAQPAIPAQSAEYMETMSAEQRAQMMEFLQLAVSGDLEGAERIVRSMTPETEDLIYRTLTAADDEAQAKTATEREPGDFTQEDYNAIVYALYEEFTEQVLKDESNPDYAEGKRVQKRFAELEGVAESSPLAIGYVFFWAGVGKGLELASRIQAIAPEGQGGNAE